MACLDMYNSEHKGTTHHHHHHHHHHHFAPMSPRISFSNDFADAQHIKQEIRSSREAPVSSDFEFSVTNYSMMSADELFFKGRLLPFKDTQMQQRSTTTTLRDELRLEDHADDVSSRPPKGRWKGLLGRKSRTHIGSKKGEKSSSTDHGPLEGRRSTLQVHEEAHHYHHVVNKTSQEALNEGGSSWRDHEIEI